jgi:hypothetical protein
MLKVFGQFRQIQPGEWKESYEIIHEGRIVGFIDHEKTPTASITMTRNLQGEIVEGEDINWLLCSDSE